jgi:ppGpp synthetase/RelA/SpoT-type nucleotidyltranferase
MLFVRSDGGKWGLMRGRVKKHKMLIENAKRRGWKKLCEEYCRKIKDYVTRYDVLTVYLRV